MTNAVPTFEETEECLRLGEKFADAAAREVIETFSDARHVDGVAHYCIDDPNMYEHERADLRDAARYLKLRRLLRHHPNNPKFVRFVDRPEGAPC